jgi:hypothetical protein
MSLKMQRSILRQRTEQSNENANILRTSSKVRLGSSALSLFDKGQEHLDCLG